MSTHNGLRHWQLFVSAVALLILTGCSQSIVVVIDNGEDQPIEVSITGAETVTVHPGEPQSVNIDKPGSAIFTVRRNGQVIRSEAHELEFAPGGLSTRKYLYNPDRTRHYAHCNVEYGQLAYSAIEGLIEENLPADKQLKFEFQSLAGEVRPLPNTGWNEINGARHLMTPLPESVTSKTSGASESTIQYITADQHARLTAAHNRNNPTQADIDALTRIANEIVEQIEYK